MKSRKHFLWLLVPLLTLLAVAADKTITDLTITTAPSTNSWIQVDDLNSAVPKSHKYLLTNLTTVAMTQTNSANWTANGATGSDLAGTASVGALSIASNITGIVSAATNRFVQNEGTNASAATNYTMNFVRSDASAVVLLGGAGLAEPSKIGVTNWIPWASAMEDTNLSIALGWYDVNATGSVSVATIGGGYDHLNNQQAGTIAGGGHNELRVGGGGSHGTIGGGSRNRIVSGDYSTIGGGTYNWMTNSSSATISGGNANHAAAANYSAIVGGYLNSISSTYGVAGGYNNIVGSSGGTAFGLDNYIPQNNEISGLNPNLATVGGRYAKARASGAVSYAGYKFAAVGDAQRGTYLLGRSMNVVGPASGTELRADASGEFIFVPTNSFWACSALVSAVSTDGTKFGAWDLKFTLYKATTAGITFTSTSLTPLCVSTNSATNWTVAPYARSYSSDYWLALQATSENTTVVRWHSVLNTVETVW